MQYFKQIILSSSTERQLTWKTRGQGITRTHLVSTRTGSLCIINIRARELWCSTLPTRRGSLIIVRASLYFTALRCSFNFVRSFFFLQLRSLSSAHTASPEFSANLHTKNRTDALTISKSPCDIRIGVLSWKQLYRCACVGCFVFFSSLRQGKPGLRRLCT